MSHLSKFGLRSKKTQPASLCSIPHCSSVWAPTVDSATRFRRPCIGTKFNASHIRELTTLNIIQKDHSLNYSIMQNKGCVLQYSYTYFHNRCASTKSSFRLNSQCLLLLHQNCYVGTLRSLKALSYKSTCISHLNIKETQLAWGTFPSKMRLLYT